VGKQIGGEKIGGFTVPLAAASQIVISKWQTAHHSNRKWAYRISIKKLNPAPGIELIWWSGGTGKKIFTSIERIF
jgi:hypothetical protein